MKKFVVVFEVDEEAVCKAAEVDDVKEALIIELGWARDSGVLVESVFTQD